MPQDTTTNNKRIAKNTIALYVRTFNTMIVGLYTSRVMLQALGVENYGINAVIGGIVGMTALLTGAMSTSISRYITYAIGEGNNDRLRVMFSTSVNAQVIMAVIVAIILEIAGVWFLNSSANIPAGRLVAANWVLQCAIVSLSISLISSPFNAEIVAHEKMSIYAYVSIIDALLRLAICFIIQSYVGDRLILLAILQIVIALIIQTFYCLYCKK
jgi:O-antigen/teichoic acid export membrane protein